MATDKAAALRLRGWHEVPADSGGTAWKTPNECGHTLYFSLDQAYDLEKDGSLYEYIAELISSESRADEDICRMEISAAEEFTRTGVYLGVPPNF